jgi:Tol biopolymer transport system component
MMNTLPKKLSHLFIICLWFLVSCNSVTPQAVTPTAHADVLPTATSVPTPTFTPTPSHNILGLNTVSEISLPSYKRECINVLRLKTNEFERTLQDFSASGTAVFSEYLNDKDTIVLLDLATGKKHFLPEDLTSDTWADDPEISPDGKWLLYLTAKENDLMGDADFVLSNSEGVAIKTLPVSIVKHRGFSYQFVHQWLGNDSLRLLSKKDYRDNNLVVLDLNPISEEITQLQNDFKGLQPPVVKAAKSIRENPQYLDWGVDPFFDVIIFQLTGANVAYSPDKNLAFYPHKDGFDVLYDVTNQKEIVQLQIPNWGELPRWSTTGENISIIATPPNYSPESAKKDFYLLSKDGKTLKRLTYLSEQFGKVSIKEYSWSPDGSKIAFWLNTDFPQSDDEDVTYELAIVDVASGNITNLCITEPSVTVKELGEHVGYLVEPVWSQNSNDLLVQVNSAEKTMPGFYTETVLVIPSKLSALAMMKGAQLKGWMVDEQ